MSNGWNWVEHEPIDEVHKFHPGDVVDISPHSRSLGAGKKGHVIQTQEWANLFARDLTPSNPEPEHTEHTEDTDPGFPSTSKLGELGRFVRVREEDLASWPKLLLHGKVNVEVATILRLVEAALEAGEL